RRGSGIPPRGWGGAPIGGREAVPENTRPNSLGYSSTRGGPSISGTYRTGNSGTWPRSDRRSRQIVPSGLPAATYRPSGLTATGGGARLLSGDNRNVRRRIGSVPGCATTRVLPRLVVRASSRPAGSNAAASDQPSSGGGGPGRVSRTFPDFQSMT